MMELIPYTKVLKIIQRIRESYDPLQDIYTRGACIKFAMVLKEIFPAGEILYDSNHAIFEYNGKCYDINGLAKKTPNHIPLQDYGLLHAYDLMNLQYQDQPKAPPNP